jgi:hypothetical protein
MIQITLGGYDYQPDQEDDFLPRRHSGWHQDMTDQEVFASARGWWVLDRNRAEREKYAIVTAQGSAIQAIEISEWRTRTDPRGQVRHAFDGKILAPGNPIYDRYVGKPLPSASRNPIHYVTDPADPAGTCKCGCGQATSGTWVAGHDQRAIRQRIGRDFGGDVAAFIDWYDQNDRP